MQTELLLGFSEFGKLSSPSVLWWFLKDFCSSFLLVDRRCTQHAHRPTAVALYEDQNKDTTPHLYLTRFGVARIGSQQLSDAVRHAALHRTVGREQFEAFQPHRSNEKTST